MTDVYAEIMGAKNISTHTPAWGVTWRALVVRLRVRYFNSHARVGRDVWRKAKDVADIHFNSHARVGRDSQQQVLPRYRQHFNSHARVGRDLAMPIVDCTCDMISTHTPAWGVTQRKAAAE